MKRLILALFVAGALQSCDKRKDLFQEENTAAAVQLQLLNDHSPWSSTLSGNNVQDTLKVGTNYSFTMTISDESASTSIAFEGSGTLMMDGQPFTAGTLQNGTHNFEWIADTTGNRSFELSITDVYGIENTYNFSIYVFVNWTPYISWVLVDVNQLDPLEKKIIVDGHDGDQLYGGEIIYYQYIINADTTNYPGNQMHYIFPSPGMYNIGVRAMDSNNEWSNVMFVSGVEVN